MIYDAFDKTTEGEELTPDICIIGSGAAGLAMAHRLIAKDKKLEVVVLESSRHNDCQVVTDEPPQPHRYADPMVQRIYGGQMNGGTDEVFFSNGRIRAYGGTTNCWQGWTRPLTGTDFDRTDIAPHMVWPTNVIDNLNEKYYQEAMAYCSLGAWDFARYRNDNMQYRAWIEEAAESRIELDLLDLSSDPDTETAVVMQIAGVSLPGERVDANWGFQFKWGPQVEQSDNVTIYRNANVLCLDQSRNNRLKVTTLSMDDHNNKPVVGHSFYVAPKKAVVLAASCIENVRLLRASGYDQKGWPALGRYLMDHPLITTAAWFEVDKWPSSGINQFYGGQTSLFRQPVSGTQVAVVFATLAATEQFRKDKRIGNFRAWVTFGNQQKNERVGNINLCWEMMPDVDNQVVGLSDTCRDPVFDAKLPDVKLELKRVDNDTWSRALAVVASVLKDNNIAKNVTQTTYPARLKGEHVMGATRMAADIGFGVVDDNCKMHNVGNLYIAGGSVMPTAGWANPTLTIIALAVRLADHLKTKFG